MHTVNIKRKRAVVVALIVVLVYILVKPREYKFSAFDTYVKHSPQRMWEFVADFNNMKDLNPTISDFTIVSESGNYQHWKYSVEYTERLSHWPYLSNTAIAHVDVKAKTKIHTYLILSTHKTCFSFNLFCLYSKGEFKFTDSYDYGRIGTFYEENIVYECPPLLKTFCKAEVEYQRLQIMKNLKKRFGG